MIEVADNVDIINFIFLFYHWLKSLNNYDCACVFGNWLLFCRTDTDNTRRIVWIVLFGIIAERTRERKKKSTIARFAAFDNLCFSLCFLIVIAMRQMRLLINKQFVCIVGWPSYFSSQFDGLF